MTEKQYQVQRAKLDVQKAEIALREARSQLEHGAAAAKATYDREYDKLKLAVEQAAVAVEWEKAWLQRKEAELEEPWTRGDGADGEG